MVRMSIVLVCTACLYTGCSSSPRQVQSTVSSSSQAEIQEARELAIQSLLSLVEHVRPVVRANAIEAFSAAPNEGGAAIEGGLRDSNEGVRSVAAVVVGRVGLESAVGWLRPLVLDDSEFVRSSAVYALSMLGENVDPTPLATTLFDSPNPRARSHAAFLLGEMGDKSAVEMLRQATLEGMSRVTTSELRLLRLQIAEAMIKLGQDEALPGVYAALFPSRPEEYELAALAIQIIGEVGDRKSIDQLIYLVSEEGDRAMPPEIRLASADALAKLGLPQGGFIADEYAQDASESIRAYSAIVYGRTDAPGNLEKARLMLQDQSPIVRVAASRAILDLTNTNE